MTAPVDHHPRMVQIVSKGDETVASRPQMVTAARKAPINGNFAGSGHGVQMLTRGPRVGQGEEIRGVYIITTGVKTIAVDFTVLLHGGGWDGLWPNHPASEDDRYPSSLQAFLSSAVVRRNFYIKSGESSSCQNHIDVIATHRRRVLY